MSAIKTQGNQPETVTLETLAARLDHLDTGIHLILQKVTAVNEFVDEHRPALARAMALMDPGSKLRGMFTRKGRDGAGEGQ